MDLVTAAGEPKILIAGTISADGLTGNGTVTFTEAGVVDLILASGAQAGLQALVLNNIAGDNSVATGVNMNSTLAGGAGVNQSNTIVQSWGSAMDLFIKSSPGGTATFTGTKCIAFASPCAKGGDGKTTRGTAYADQIFVGSSVSVVEIPDTQLVFDADVQAGLAALVVNNVAGKNLVGSAFNLSYNTGTLFPNFDLGGGSAGATVQSNSITQYRGSPVGYSSR
jgi:hypothetical protein